MTRREAGLESGLPPGRSRITSPYDLDARYSQKRGKEWRGYKVHLTETCTHPGAPAAPNLITNVATTAAAVPDAAMTEPVHDMLAAAGLSPGEHAADAGYAGADLLLAARARGITLLAPLAVPSSPQARAGGYTADMFAIDWDRQQVTCPQGAASRPWSAARPGDRDGFTVAVSRRCLPGLPGPRQVHHLSPPGPAAVPAPPRDPRGRHRPAGQPDRPGMERPVRHPGRRRRHHPPGHRRHRHPHRPLPRTAQNQPRARRRRHRHQPDPPRRLADQQTTRPDTHHLPPAAHPHHRRLSPQ